MQIAIVPTQTVYLAYNSENLKPLLSFFVFLKNTCFAVWETETWKQFAEWGKSRIWDLSSFLLPRLLQIASLEKRRCPV